MFFFYFPRNETHREHESESAKRKIKANRIHTLRTQQANDRENNLKSFMKRKFVLKLAKAKKKKNKNKKKI